MVDRAREAPPSPLGQKQRRIWPAQSLWVRALPPASYTEPPPRPGSATELKRTGFWAAGKPIDTADLLFATDATGTTKDPRTRVVAAAVIACRWINGELVEVGRLTQVLPPFTSVVQGEAMALALLLKHTKGQVEVTVDCQPAIVQAQCSFFKAAHTNVWEEVWEDRHRLLCTWHPSHRPPEEYQQRYGSASHWRVVINELADKACKEAAAAVPWQRHAAQVAQLDELVEEIAHFLADRAWTLLVGQEAPPLDVKPRNKPKPSLPAKSKANKDEAKPKTKQAQNRPAADGGLNKKQRLELLLAGEDQHGELLMLEDPRSKERFEPPRRIVLLGKGTWRLTYNMGDFVLKLSDSGHGNESNMAASFATICAAVTWVGPIRVGFYDSKSYTTENFYGLVQQRVVMLKEDWAFGGVRKKGDSGLFRMLKLFSPEIHDEIHSEWTRMRLNYPKRFLTFASKAPDYAHLLKVQKCMSAKGTLSSYFNRG
eukprot:s3937_g6.t1